MIVTSVFRNLLYGVEGTLDNSGQVRAESGVCAESIEAHVIFGEPPGQIGHPVKLDAELEKRSWQHAQMMSIASP